MSAFHPPIAPLNSQTTKGVVFPNGHGGLMLGGTAFISITHPTEARLLALRFSELANAMEATEAVPSE